MNVLAREAAQQPLAPYYYVGNTAKGEKLLEGKKSAMRIICFRMPPSDTKKLDALAQAMGIRRSEFTRQLIAAAISKSNQQGKALAPLSR